VGKPKIKRDTWGICTLGGGKIEMDIELIGQEDVDRIYLAEDMKNWRAVVNTVMNLLGL